MTDLYGPRMSAVRIVGTTRDIVLGTLLGWDSDTRCFGEEEPCAQVVMTIPADIVMRLEGPSHHKIVESVRRILLAASEPPQD